MLLVGVPSAVLLGAFLWLAWEHETVALWSKIVHESERYTLGQTVLYFGHFLREVPVDIAMALFIVAALPASVSTTGRSAGSWIAGLLACLLVGLAWLLAGQSHGGESALRDLLQYRTRDDLEAYGSHWHFHWLSTLWMGAAAPVFVRILSRVSGQPTGRAANRLTLMAWGFFLALTAVFGLSAATFADPRYIGHQAREMITHAPVTLLLTLGLLQLAGQLSAGPPAPPRPASRVVPGVQLAASLFIPAYLGWKMLTMDVMASGQGNAGLSAMLGGHFFEHSLDYLLVALIALAIRPLVSPRTTLSQP